MTKENSYLVSSPSFFSRPFAQGCRKIWKSGGRGQVYSNPRYLEGKSFDSIPAKIWVVNNCTPAPQVPTVLLHGIFLVWFEKDLKVKFNQICIKRKGNISLIGTKNASWNERITVISVTYEVICSTDQNSFHIMNQMV